MVDDRLIQEIQRDPTHILGWFDLEVMNIWMTLFPLFPVPAQFLSRQTVVVTYLSTPFTHLSDFPPQMIQLNQIVTQSTQFLPNLQSFQNNLVVETLLPIPEPPRLDFHCLFTIPREFILPGQFPKVEKILAELDLLRLRVIAKSYMTPVNWALEHSVCLTPYWNRKKKTSLDPGWVSS